MRSQSSALRPGQAAVTVIPKFFMILYLRKRHHHPLSVHGGFLLGPAVHRLVPGDEGWLKYNAAKVRWLMIFSIRLSSQGSHSLYFSRRSAKYSGLARSITYNSSYISGHFQRSSESICPASKRLMSSKERRIVSRSSSLSFSICMIAAMILSEYMETI